MTVSSRTRSLLESPGCSRAHLRVCLALVTGLLTFGAAESRALEDTTPPVLSGLALSPSSVDVSSGPAVVTVIAVITDDLSGVADGNCPADEPQPIQIQFVQYVPGWGFTVRSRLAVAVPLGGDVYAFPLTIPQYSPQGRWTIDYLSLGDCAGNWRSRYGADLAADGYPTSFEVTSAGDTAPPVLSRLDLSPSAVDVSSGADVVTVTATITDSLAGVAHGNACPTDAAGSGVYVRFQSPSGGQTRVALGVPRAGDVYEFPVIVPRHAEQGTWTLQHLSVVDCVGNALASQYILSFDVTSAGDTAPPVVSALALSPSAVDVSSGDAVVTVTAAITDDLVGVAAGNACAAPGSSTSPVQMTFRSPSFRQGRSGAAVPLGGDLYAFSVTVPQYAEEGTWTLDFLVLVDCLGNTRYRHRADLAADGYPTTFRVLPAPSRFVVEPTTWSVPAGGGTRTLTVTSTSPSASWTAASGVTWVTVTPTTGVGSGTVTLTAAAQASATPRTTTVTVADQGVMVTQASATGTSVTLISGSTIDLAAGEGTFQIEWSASGGTGNATIASTTDWLAVGCGTGGTPDVPTANACTTADGAGTYVRTVTVAANSGAQPRIGTVTVTGVGDGNTVIVRVTQAGATPTFTVSPSLWDAPAVYATQTVSITTSVIDAPWTATSDAGWLTVIPPAGAGTGSLTLIVMPHTAATPRTATATIAGQAVAVSQPAATRIIRLSGNLAFGRVPIGTTATATLTITNDGTSPLTVIGISVPSGFSGAWSGRIAPAASQNVDVTFTPVTATAYGGALNVSADHGTGTNTIEVSGAGSAVPTAANGKLQIHHLDVGQGDAAAIISPLGEVVLIDSGASDQCAAPVAYLRSIGVTQINYHVASHYHDDHIGCTADVLSAFPLFGPAYDRGQSHDSEVFRRYWNALDTRRAAEPGTRIVLDAFSDSPVLISFVAANGNGVPTADENALSVVTRVDFGAFQAVFGGDLTGSDPDIESVVAQRLGQIELYKVHNHGSASSSNWTWVSTTRPTVAVISVGPSNPYGHPARDVVDRLHAVGAKTFWTTRGNGAAPLPGVDVVGGDIRVEVAPGAPTFTVTHSGGVETFDIAGPLPALTQRVQIDTPRPGDVGVSFVISGWAVDGRNPSSPFGTDSGVDAVHVWAHPQPGGAPIFVGAAEYGLSRPDVAEFFGNTAYIYSGFALTVPRMLAGGTYRLVAYARSRFTGTFDTTGSVLVTVASIPFMSIDSPVPGAVIRGPIQLSGWAIDFASLTGTGVDAVHVHAYSARGGSAIFLGAATYGLPRVDVGGLFGASRFAPSGWTFEASLPAGEYRLAVYARSTVAQTFNKVMLIPVTIVGSEPRVVIDTPVTGATLEQPFTISGWAVDLGAASGPGVDAVHAYAYPNPGSGQAPVFLGAAAYGRTRPDVAAALGHSQFTNSGYTLPVNGLPAGSYLFALHAHSTVTNTFTAVQTVTATVMATATTLIDTPSNGDTVSPAFAVSGWAIDRAAASGTGVDTIHVYATPAGRWAPEFLGVATYGTPRADVGAAFGTQFTHSGYSLDIAALGGGAWDIIVYARSTVADRFTDPQIVRVNVHVTERWLFGGPNYETFIGCFNCSPIEPHSIHNPLGPYGSRASNTSIWNHFSMFGSRSDPNSACNELATHPPIIVDEFGSTVYGEFTVNLSRPDALRDKTIVSWLMHTVCEL